MKVCKLDSLSATRHHQRPIQHPSTIRHDRIHRDLDTLRLARDTLPTPAPAPLHALRDHIARRLRDKPPRRHLAPHAAVQAHIDDAVAVLPGAWQVLFGVSAAVVAERWPGVGVGAGVVWDVAGFVGGEEFGGLAAGGDVEVVVVLLGAALDWGTG